MSAAPATPTPPDHRPFRIVDLNYVSLYVQDLPAAIAFYSQVFGPPEVVDERKAVHGWRMGATWLTLFPGSAGTGQGGNPANAEFAIRVSSVHEVDVLHRALVEAGAREYMAPEDTVMYEPMRFACVDDPFGVRIDVYCPIDNS